MDRWIKFFEEAPLRKKILIVIGVCLILLAFMGISKLLTDINKQNTPTAQQSSESSNPSSDNSSEGPLIEPMDTSGWKAYRKDSYSFNYPPSAVFHESSEEGVEIVLLSGVAHNTEYAVELQVISGVASLDEEIYSPFRNSEYTEQDAVLGGIDGKEFIGKLGDKQWERAAVVENGGRVYMLKLSYTSDSFSQYIEEIFRNLLLTFKFN